jgi:hypothetical protein
MAQLNGQMFGDMKGKLGGMVFTRNKAGKVVRALVKPTDAKTPQQQSVRARFSNAAASYHSLTAAQLSGWGQFASTNFVPKKSKSTVSFSGYQAFTSCNQLLACSKAATGTFAITTPPATTTWSATVAQNMTAPTAGFNSSISKSDASAIIQSLSSVAYVAATRVLTITLNFSQTTGATAPTFIPVGGGGHSGYAVYFSIPLGFSAVTSHNPEAYLLVASGSPSVTAGWTAVTSMIMTATVSSSYLSGLKASFAAGQRVIATAYAINELGQCSKLGAQIITIS